MHNFSMVDMDKPRDYQTISLSIQHLDDCRSHAKKAASETTSFNLGIRTDLIYHISIMIKVQAHTQKVYRYERIKI